MRRFPLAIVLVVVLALLAAGGAVLGAFQGPSGADLTVHNGAGETLLATHIVGRYTTSQVKGVAVTFDFHAPDHVSEAVVSSSGKVESRHSFSGPDAVTALGPVKQLLKIDKFAKRGSLYERTLPASVLVPRATRTKVVGIYRTSVQVEGGYAVTVDITIDARANGRNLVETRDYVLSRVDGWSRSH